MTEFLMIFRRELNPDQPAPSPEQMQAHMKPWQDWMGGLAAQNKLVSSGNRLKGEGRVVKPNGVITNGPYVEIKEAVGGYIIVRAESLDEAAELSKGCPMFEMGGNVEVRAIVPMD